MEVCNVVPDHDIDHNDTDRNDIDHLKQKFENIDSELDRLKEQHVENTEDVNEQLMHMSARVDHLYALRHDDAETNYRFRINVRNIMTGVVGAIVTLGLVMLAPVNVVYPHNVDAFTS